VSTHAAAVVITQEPTTEYVPVQRPVRGESSEISMTQFPMGPIAKLGLLKMDFLGLANLTVLKRVMGLIHQRHGRLFTLQDVPLDDETTFKLLSSGETADVFQLEGTGMRKHIRELKPSSLEEVAAMIALYRPGPMEHIDTYIRAKHGQAEVQYPHSSLKELLEETYGVIVYQDQVLRIAQRFAGYSLGEADIVRKAMGKKVPEIMREERERFISGAVLLGYTKDEAESVFDLIEPFAGYAFNKAHAVSYALIAYWTAYFKANYQLEYMTSVLNIRMGNTEKIAGVVGECHRLLIPVLPPDLNKSETDFHIEELIDGKHGIRFGLAAVKNVGEQAAKTIEAARFLTGAFDSIEDMCHRVDTKGTNRRTLESLIKVGAMDSLNPDRLSILSGLDRIVSLAQKEARIRESGQRSMFEILTDSVEETQSSLEFESGPLMTDSEKAEWERELLGISFSDESFRDLLSNVDPSDAIVSIAAVDLDNTKERLNFIGQVASIRPGLTRKGQQFVVVEISLLDGKLRALVWPDVYEKTKAQWEEGNLLRVKGRIRSGSDSLEINCDDASPFSMANMNGNNPRFGSSGKLDSGSKVSENRFVGAKPFLRLVIRETEDPQYDETRLRGIIKILLEYEGNEKVYLDMFSGRKKILMEIPYTTTICTDLKNELIEMLGEEAVYAGESMEKEPIKTSSFSN